MKTGSKYGIHRVIEPQGVLPQAAAKIDNKMEIYPNEILIGILVIAAIALIVKICMWRSRVKDRRQEENEKADNFLRQNHQTLSEQDDEAFKLAEKYKESE